MKVKKKSELHFSFVAYICSLFISELVGFIVAMLIVMAGSCLIWLYGNADPSPELQELIFKWVLRINVPAAPIYCLYFAMKH